MPLSNIVWTEKADLMRLVRRKLGRADTLLDVGTGVRPQTLIWPKLHICVEAYEEYVDCLRQSIGDSSRYLIVQSRWQGFMNTLPPKSVDTVVALDFIEHLEKEEGLAFIAQAEKLARRQVIIFTPLGYFLQSYDDPSEKDRWGLSGGYWQTHRSGWLPEDFPPPWEIFACREYHLEDQHGRPLEDSQGCIWAIRTFDDASVATPAAAGRSAHLTGEYRLWGLTVLQHAPGWFQRLIVGLWQLRRSAA